MPLSTPPTSARRRPAGLRARLKRPGRSSTFGFTVRLSLAIAATVATLGIAGYLMMGDQLQRRLLATYAAEHRADVATFVDAELRSGSSLHSHREVRRLVA